jgi:predicted DNA-binding ribbon-helix-helix protein
MPSHIRPRQVVVLGHPTSVRLEPPYWFWLRFIAAELGTTVRKFVESVRIAHPNDPLSSTLRVQIANYFYSHMPAFGYVDPHSKRVFLVKKPGAGRRAAEAVRANPDKSDRTIAGELGISKATVQRARKATSSM